MIGAFLSGSGDFVGKVLFVPVCLAAFLLAAPMAAAQSVFPQTAPHQAAPAAPTANDLETLRHALDAARDAYGQTMADTTLPPGATQEELLARGHLQRELVTNLEQSLEMAQRLPDDPSFPALLKQAQEAQSSNSGVNLDEEAANLIKFQQLYQANSKVIQTASTLFDTILQMVN